MDRMGWSGVTTATPICALTEPRFWKIPNHVETEEAHRTDRVPHDFRNT